MVSTVCTRDEETCGDAVDGQLDDVGAAGPQIAAHGIDDATLAGARFANQKKRTGPRRGENSALAVATDRNGITRLRLVHLKGFERRGDLG